MHTIRLLHDDDLTYRLWWLCSQHCKARPWTSRALRCNDKRVARYIDSHSVQDLIELELKYVHVGL